jgi:hypothetical protein
MLGFSRLPGPAERILVPEADLDEKAQADGALPPRSFIATDGRRIGRRRPWDSDRDRLSETVWDLKFEI